MRNAHFESLDEIKDVESYNVWAVSKKMPILGKRIRKILFDVSRDNARTPMIWDDSQYGGFSTVEPWIRVNPSKNEVNVKKALEDKNSLYYFYKELIRIRKEHRVVVDGEYNAI